MDMNLQQLKRKSPSELIEFAEQHDIENASALRKQELMFAIFKKINRKKCCYFK